MSGGGGGAMKLTIELTAKEKRVCELLKDVVEANHLNTVMRIAGGWVRDKILGKQSDDIDIALDNMMGKDFAEHINSYLTERGEPKRTIGVIKVNPQQSKHLETATLNIFNQWIDFVNLRSESYESDSRIPSHIGFGTPLQDSLRRDITINSLFYNINEDRVEDFTGKGLEDLSKGIIRTPMDPLVTFEDDPLRCLRVIRFASRFNFLVEEKTYQALSSDISKNGIRSKISKERIGKELEKMLKDENPSISSFHLFQTELFDIVFKPHDDGSLLPQAAMEGVKTSRCAYWLLQNNFCDFKLSDEEKKLLFLSSNLISYRSSIFHDKKNKPIPEPSFIVLESIKFPTKDSNNTWSILNSVEKAKELRKQSSSSIPRKVLGLFLREPTEHWRVALLLSLAHEISLFLQTIDPKTEVVFLDDIRPVVEDYQKLVHMILSSNLDNSWNEKPLFNGKEIKALLALPDGPILGVVGRELLDWQLENPGASLEQAKSWLAQQKEAGGFAVPRK